VRAAAAAARRDRSTDGRSHVGNTKSIRLCISTDAAAAPWWTAVPPHRDATFALRTFCSRPSENYRSGLRFIIIIIIIILIIIIIIAVIFL